MSLTTLLRNLTFEAYSSYQILKKKLWPSYMLKNNIYLNLEVCNENNLNLEVCNESDRQLISQCNNQIPLFEVSFKTADQDSVESIPIDCRSPGIPRPDRTTLCNKLRFTHLWTSEIHPFKKLQPNCSTAGACNKIENCHDRC